jgi:hypothetical protein
MHSVEGLVGEGLRTLLRGCFVQLFAAGGILWCSYFARSFLIAVKNKGGRAMSATAFRVFL